MWAYGNNPCGCDQFHLNDAVVSSQELVLSSGYETSNQKLLEMELLQPLWYTYMYMYAKIQSFTLCYTCITSWEGLIDLGKRRDRHSLDPSLTDLCRDVHVLLFGLLVPNHSDVVDL